ncbi:MAG: efflux RND transporter periplasmic adaptor subunit [Candidatus Zixiibacteriota bacterium]|nr:MAG: efflux RND transporter periplasmic adaptor subunit [candidate division Zixibacteria bacterium]
MRRNLINLLLIVLVAILPLSCGKKNNTAISLPTIPVKTLAVTPGTIEITREFSGGLEGVEQADIYIRLSEAVTALPFKVGDHVQAGQVLITLDRGGASSQYIQAKAMFENAEKNFQKMKYLFDEKAISETAFDGAKTGFQVAKANYDAAKELVDITSPISGTLVGLDVKVGDIPRLGLLAARVARTDALRMTVGVPADLVSKFSRGMNGSLRAAGDDSVYTCTVTKVSDAADPQTRTFSVEISVSNESRRLQAGTFAKSTFVVDRKENVLKVPQVSMISSEGVMSLYVVKNDTATSRTVNVGIGNGTDTEVLSGLSAGEEVVVVGQSFLSDGYPITRSAK